MRRLRAIVLLLLVSTTAAAAPESRHAALEAFSAAKDAFAHHDYREAALGFDEADRLAPEPRARFDAAVAWDRAGDLGRAADRYASALPLLAGREHETASTRLEVLQKKLAVLHVDGRPGLRIDVGDEVDLPLPVAMHLAAGRYDIRVHGGAGETTRTVEVRPGESVSIHYDEAPAPTATPTPTIGPPARAAVPIEPAPIPARRSRAPAFGVLGAAAGLTIAGTLFGVLGIHARDTLVESGRMDADARDRAVALRAGSIVAFGGAAVCAAISVWLFLRPSPGQWKSQTVSTP